MNQWKSLVSDKGNLGLYFGTPWGIVYKLITNKIVLDETYNTVEVSGTKTLN